MFSRLQFTIYRVTRALHLFPDRHRLFPDRSLPDLHRDIHIPQPVHRDKRFPDLHFPGPVSIFFYFFYFFFNVGSPSGLPLF